jgi:hypothetical protein
MIQTAKGGNLIDQSEVQVPGSATTHPPPISQYFKLQACCFAVPTTLLFKLASAEAEATAAATATATAQRFKW